MEIREKEKITTIIASAQLPMYGFVALFIRQEDNGVLVGWREIEEGGHVYEDEEREFDKLSISSLLMDLEIIDTPVQSEPCESICWSVQFGDADDYEVDAICGTEDGNINRSVLEEILDKIERFLDFEEVTGPFRRMLAM